MDQSAFLTKNIGHASKLAHREADGDGSPRIDSAADGDGSPRFDRDAVGDPSQTPRVSEGTLAPAPPVITSEASRSATRGPSAAATLAEKRVSNAS